MRYHAILHGGPVSDRPIETYARESSVIREWARLVLKQSPAGAHVEVLELREIPVAEFDMRKEEATGSPEPVLHERQLLPDTASPFGGPVPEPEVPCQD